MHEPIEDRCFKLCISEAAAGGEPHPANSVEKLCAFVVDDVFRGASPLPACEIVDFGAI
jgi:hypothetical protein